LRALARSTGATINRGQETATQHDCGAFGTDSFSSPRSVGVTKINGLPRSGVIPCRATTLISGARCRFQLELLNAANPPPGRLVLFSNQPPYKFHISAQL
jgi:hypothetical protein